MTDKRTDKERKDAFLLAYGNLVDVEQAAASAGVSSACHYYWKKQDATYRAAWELTLEHLLDRLITAGYHRAIHGVPKLIMHKGAVIEAPVINRYTGLVQIDNDGKTVMAPLVEWTIDHRAWEILLRAWGAMVYNRAAIPVQPSEITPPGKTKVKKIVLEDQRTYPRMTGVRR